MSVRRLSNSTISTQGRGKSSTFLAGYSPAIDEMDLIQRVTVGAGGASFIEFTSIPATYQHLQVRGLLRSTTAASLADDVRLRLGNLSIDTGSNYAGHTLEGNGTSVQSVSWTSLTWIARIGYAPRANSTANAWGGIVIDILDYASTSKTKTSRSVCGVDLNGTGVVTLASGLWNSTNAVTNIRLFSEANNFSQYSTLSLYGVTG